MPCVSLHPTSWPSPDRGSASGASQPKGDCTHFESGAFDDSQPPKKSAARVEARIAASQIAPVPAAADDVIEIDIEIDEVCMRVTRSLWLGVAVSRQVGQVLGFVICYRGWYRRAACLVLVGRASRLAG